MKLKYSLPKGLTYRPYLLDMVKGNHTLIAGMTGAGKSVLENDIIYALLCTCFPNGDQGAKFVLIDPKKVELSCYKELPHTIMYADNIETSISALKNVRQIIDNRLNEMQRAGQRKYLGCPIYVIIDELVDLMTSKQAKEITRLIADSISIARATGVYFLMCTQAPNRTILRAEILLNTSCRCALFCRDPQESRQIIGDSSACSLPKHGLGIVQDGTERYMIKIPMYSDGQISDIVQHWTAQHPFINALQRRNKII